MRTYGRKFWRDAFERAVKTAGQGAGVAGLGLATSVVDLGAWQALGAAAVTGFVLSIITSIGSAPVGEGDSASAIDLTKPPA